MPGSASCGEQAAGGTPSAASPAHGPRIVCCVPLTDAQVAVALAPAGLQFIEREPGKVRPPLQPGKTPASSRAADGRFDAAPGEVVDIDDPDFVAKLNGGWLRMATEFGLLSDRCEFLVNVDYSESVDTGDPERAWVRVQLTGEWDIAGSGVERLGGHVVLGSTVRYVPAFWALSLDQRVLLETTLWGNGTVSTIAIRPSDPPSRHQEMPG